MGQFTGCGWKTRKLETTNLPSPASNANSGRSYSQVGCALGTLAGEWWLHSTLFGQHQLLHMPYGDFPRVAIIIDNILGYGALPVY